MDIQISEVSGTTRAAVLLVTMGVETASRVLTCMDEELVERLSVEIARLKNVSGVMVDAVLTQYADDAGTQTGARKGGTDLARQMISKALGDDKAGEMIERVEQALKNSAFHMLQKVENSQLSGFLQNEHPQTAALILSHIHTRKASEIVALLPDEQQQEILYRLATMGKTSPALLKDIEEVIRQQVGSLVGSELSTSGGVEMAAEILNSVNRSVERSIMSAITERDPNVAGGIKALMFVFDDLVNLTGRDLQRLLTEVDQKDLVLSLKGSSDELKEKLLENVSERAKLAIQEELELLGPVRVSDVEDAQRRVIETAQELEEREEITIARGAGEEVVL